MCWWTLCNTYDYHCVLVSASVSHRRPLSMMHKWCKSHSGLQLCWVGLVCCKRFSVLLRMCLVCLLFLLVLWLDRRPHNNMCNNVLTRLQDIKPHSTEFVSMLHCSATSDLPSCFLSLEHLWGLCLLRLLTMRCQPWVALASLVHHA